MIYYDHARLVVHGPAYRFSNPSPPMESNFSIIDRPSSTHPATRPVSRTTDKINLGYVLTRLGTP